MFEINGKFTNAKIFIDEVDETTLSQIYSMINCEAFNNPISIMPDCHAGAGSVIGFTMPLGDKIIPNVVGVDISCGMLARKVEGKVYFTNKKEFEEFDNFVKTKIPFGFEIHKKSVINVERHFPYQEALKIAMNFKTSYEQKFNKTIPSVPNYNYEWFKNKCKQVGVDCKKIEASLGSVGGGNHFIEVGKDLSKQLWITVHSGSRHFGKKVCEYWQKRAQIIDHTNDINEIIKNTKDKSQIQSRIQEFKNKQISKPKGLEWLEDIDYFGYLYDMIFCQVYASINRKIISDMIIKDYLKSYPSEEIESIHNYIDFKDMVIRKGAISSYQNQKMVIPFNMKDGILVCEGKSNSEWNYSAPHGAGRIMSRSKAKASLNLEDYKKEMEGIYSTCISKYTLDESPMVYKNPEMIKKCIEPTAIIIDRIEPILNIKDNSGKEND